MIPTQSGHCFNGEKHKAQRTWKACLTLPSEAQQWEEQRYVMADVY